MQVIIEVRKEETNKDALPKPITVRAARRTLCNPQHAYIITGGLGGFGLELTQWLIHRGAKKFVIVMLWLSIWIHFRIVLTSRSGVKTGYQARCLHFWRRAGIKVHVSTRSVGMLDETRHLISDTQQQIGPVAGIFHLAMVLRDTLFENQNRQNFKDAAEAKYHGTRNLDIVTRELCNDLKW